MAVKSKYTKENMEEVIAQLHADGYELSATRKALEDAIFRVTDLAHPLAVNQFVKTMELRGFIHTTTFGRVWVFGPHLEEEV